MMRIEFENGSVIEWAGRSQAKDHKVIRGDGSKNIWYFHDDETERKDEELRMKEEIKYLIGYGNNNEEEKEQLIKLLNANGKVEAQIPNHSELLNAIVGYEHDPETHNYNRAERRRIIKAAKELEKKYKRGRK